MVSSIGVPIIMDRMTTSICEKPYGRASFARVLVEIDSNKALVDNVELWVAVKEKGTSNDEVNNGNGDEWWQIAGNRRNNRGAGNNFRQGSVGGYNVRRGFNNYRGDFNNRGNHNMGNAGKVDECVVINESGESSNKGKSKVNESGASTAGINMNGNDDLKKNMANNNPSNKSEKASNKGNKSGKGSRSGNEVGEKDCLGTKCVATSNRFDLLSGDNESAESDLLKEVKGLVVVACDTVVPIAENILKGWNADMVKFYTIKWQGRNKKKGSVKQQFESEMESLSSQIVKLNRNINNNAKLYADRMLMKSGLTTQDKSDISFTFSLKYCSIVISQVSWVCWFCSNTGLWSSNRVFDRGDADSDYGCFLWSIMHGLRTTGVNKINVWLCYWMANMIMVNCRLWSLFKFCTDEGLLRTVSCWIFIRFMVSANLTIFSMWFPSCWCSDPVSALYKLSLLIVTFETVLFFCTSCNFSKSIWDNLKPLCKLDDLSYIWAEIVLGLSIRIANNSIWSVVQRLVFGAAVYYIWQERNIRIFQHDYRTEETVFKIIVDTIRYKLMGLNIKNSREVLKVAEIWKLPQNGFVGGNSMGSNGVNDGFMWICNLCRAADDYDYWVCCANLDLSTSCIDQSLCSCNFSKSIWDNLKPLCKLDDLSGIWAEIVLGLSIRIANNSIWSVVQRLVFGAAVYYIWQERNIRIFQHVYRTEETVFKIIVNTVRYKLMGLNIKNSREVLKVAEIWKLPQNGFVGGNSMGSNGVNDGLLMIMIIGVYAGLLIYVLFHGYVFSVRVLVFGVVTGFLTVMMVFLSNLLCTTETQDWSMDGYALQEPIQVSALALCIGSDEYFGYGYIQVCGWLCRFRLLFIVISFAGSVFVVLYASSLLLNVPGILCAYLKWVKFGSCFIDFIDVDLFSVIDLNDMVKKLGYKGKGFLDTYLKSPFTSPHKVILEEIDEVETGALVKKTIKKPGLNSSLIRMPFKKPSLKETRLPMLLLEDGPSVNANVDGPTMNANIDGPSVPVDVDAPILNEGASVNETNDANNSKSFSGENETSSVSDGSQDSDYIQTDDEHEVNEVDVEMEEFYKNVDTVAEWVGVRNDNASETVDLETLLGQKKASGSNTSGSNDGGQGINKVGGLRIKVGGKKGSYIYEPITCPWTLHISNNNQGTWTV
ncbi:reverse transcriptase zinc-binding domain-containing protein [Artemisia annua]|uniref:Reverse transcriptase zinc-binding domain-containing protein n=1 Tax=Artemisia annua TaxID=35608 RepID=A0A2U1NAU5_ARTAN|nr:reverse transcriptase zinc-binding domain-containing protein [Artemisia annua]